MKRKFFPGFLICFLFSNIAVANSIESKLQAAAIGEHRAQKNIDRNSFRHPVETLKWFGIEESMTVVEISPGGGGWYTEVLAPFLREKGKYHVASYNSESESEYLRNNAQKYLDKLSAHPDVYDRVVVTEFEPPAKSQLEPEGKADMVLTFRNTHNWVRNDSVAQTYASMYKVLKSGGILGVVQHRGNADMLGKEWANKGYVPEAEVIRMAEEAGFKFVGKSEINANPQDTKDYEKGVWTLPPVYRLKEQNRAKYEAIGESDRMTVKFIKP